MKNVVKLTVLALLVGMFSGCTWLLESLDDPTPTATLMEGVWEVTAVYNMDDGADSKVNMVDSIGLGYGNVQVPFYVHMLEDGDVHTTAGPLFLYLVYGNSNYTNFFGKLDEVFKYNDLETTNGDWLIQDGIQDDFEIQMKLMPPSMGSLTSILELFGVNTQKIRTFLQHHFSNVTVEIDDSDPDTMVWEWTDDVTGTYFTQGSSLLKSDPWLGFDATRYTRCRIVFEKKVGTIQDLIQAAQ